MRHSAHCVAPQNPLKASLTFSGDFTNGYVFYVVIGKVFEIKGGATLSQNNELPHGAHYITVKTAKPTVGLEALAVGFALSSAK
ncbi:hypothetical protein PPSC2_28385 (plasmid) [Paenibacillus polymyxa SC2]|uniref:Uncharacterized protein n=1 Tax=Paenibacillus polymyxa (strain SC2) TaxID=886882 RepID=A0A0D5ZCW6_PAEPS|nr:hypothetical protein PPSC2_28385 [Paenibacillus polymyxa SC2]